MRNLDFSSWEGVISTLIGLVVITFVMVGIRLLIMQTVQQRHERENRQINERLRTLIAAYKTLGGSFTGNLAVDPTHLRDLRRRAMPAMPPEEANGETSDDPSLSSDRSRRIRDAVEAALSDVILLGTEEQVQLAARAATDLAVGRAISTHELVVSLRDFIRKVLDLEPVSTGLTIPKQGPARPGTGKGKGNGDRSDRAGAKSGGKDASADGMAGGGGMGLGFGGGHSVSTESEEAHDAES